MKIAITGKGGVGKTTLAAVLARLYAAEGKKVLAVDVDPDANLGLALGFSAEEVAAITPVSKMEELIKERTEASSDGMGKFFKINPKVDDIPDRFGREKNGVRFLIMGTVELGGGGCVCPEHVVVKRLISHLVVQRDEVVVMDMEAGIEHLGRGTASMVDRFIVVVEPGARSVQTYHMVKKLAADLGVKNVSVVANKIRGKEDEEFIQKEIPSGALLGCVHYSDEVITADRKGVSPFDTGGPALEEFKAVKIKIDTN
ncbi:MAG: carbon monoxide dehydrogenase accessory protein CooC [Termitinemataceae bacterium]|nr:MAG: carbon monoxide dehydrogenase accessory protein CooC [Termitinemataceae bacterium]